MPADELQAGDGSKCKDCRQFLTKIGVPESIARRVGNANVPAKHLNNCGCRHALAARADAECQCKNFRQQAMTSSRTKKRGKVTTDCQRSAVVRYSANRLRPVHRSPTQDHRRDASC